MNQNEFECMCDLLHHSSPDCSKHREPRLKEADVRIELETLPCMLVLNDLGKPVGTAIFLGFEKGGIKLHLVLDPQNPEVFDLDVEPRRVEAQVSFTVENSVVVNGVVTLKSR